MNNIKYTFNNGETSSSSSSSSSRYETSSLNEQEQSTPEPPRQNNDNDDDDNNNNNKYDLPWQQQIENYKCIFFGIGVGIFSVLPFTAFHYFIYQPSYTSVPQWEFDTYTGAIQGALFCLVYRYAVRPTAPSAALGNQVIQSFVGVRTLSRIHVSFSCTALPLYCKCVALLCKNAFTFYVPYLTHLLLYYTIIITRRGRIALFILGHDGTISRQLRGKCRTVWSGRCGITKGFGSEMDSTL